MIILMQALLSHVWLALRLKHDGTGMPTSIPAATALMATYIVLVLIGKHAQADISLELVLGLAFIAQFYIFNLRNKVIGLLIMIGVIANGLSLLLTLVLGLNQQAVVMVSILEYIMVFSAVLNLIKSNFKIS